MKWIGIAHGVNTLSLGIGQLMAPYVDNNLYIFHFSILFLYAAYAIAFYYAVNNQLHKRLIITSIGVFIVLSLVLTATVQPLHVFNSYARIIFSVFLAGISLAYLYQLFVEIKVERIELNSFFWVSAGVLFTSVGSLFAYGLMAYLIEHSRSHARQVHIWIDAMRFLLIGVLLVAVYADILFAPKHLKSRR